MVPQSLAATLARAFRSGECVSPATEELPADMESAERIQDAMIAEIGPVAAWKLGAAAKSGRVQMGLPRMFIGALPTDRVYRTGATVPGQWTQSVGVECEYAYRFSRNMPARGGRGTAEEVRAAIGGIHAAFEIPATRFSGIGVHGGFAQVADNGAAGWIVIGEECVADRWEAMLDAPVRLAVAGQLHAEGSAAEIDGTPFDVIVNFVQMAHDRGYDIRAGQFVVTGSCTGYTYVPLDAPIAAEFSLGGTVEAVFCRADSRRG